MDNSMIRLIVLVVLTLVASPAWANLMFATGTFTSATGNGAQAITDATCAQPKVVIAWWNRATADATFTAHEGFGFGVAVDAGTDQQAHQEFYNTDAVNTTDSAEQKSSVAFIVNQKSVTPSSAYTAVITSFNSDGFTITYSGNDDTNHNIIHYVCLGGSDITNAYLGEFTGPSATGDAAFTGVGFQGNLGLFFGMRSTVLGADNRADYEFWVGAAKSATERAVVATYGDDGNATPLNKSESYLNSAAVLAVPSGGGLAIANLADFKTWDADGFTFTYSALGGVNAVVFNGLILKGTFRSAIATQARNTGNGTQDVTSPGFPPEGLMLFGGFPTASATETVQGHLVIGAGEATGSVSDNGTWVSDSAQATTTDVNMYSSASKIYTQATNPNTVAAQADLNAWLSNGYQLNWTTTDANARLFFHLALAGASRQASSPIIFP